MTPEKRIKELYARQQQLALKELGLRKIKCGKPIPMNTILKELSK